MFGSNLVFQSFGSKIKYAGYHVYIFKFFKLLTFAFGFRNRRKKKIKKVKIQNANNPCNRASCFLFPFPIRPHSPTPNRRTEAGRRKGDK